MNTWHRANTISLAGISLLSVMALAFVAFSKMPQLASLDQEVSDHPSIEDTIIQHVNDSSKDVWVNIHGKRHHYHMESPTSRFVLKHDLYSNKIVEEMDDMRLWMQDRIAQTPKPIQEVRFIKSPYSTFCFSERSLKTENSFVAMYTTPGKDLSLYLKPEQVTLRGNADAFDIIVDEAGVHFNAKGFSAQINNMDHHHE